jgi:hypothetical protein
MESYVVANPLDKILKAFPRWTKEGVKEALKIDVWLETQFKVENSEGKVLSPEDQAVNDAVEAAGRNIIAVIGSVTQSSIYTDAEHQLSPNLATALGYLQFLLVDINDNLSERFIGNEYDDQHTVEGRFIRGMGLYRKLAAIVSPDDFRDNYQDADSNFALSEQLSTKLDGARITLSEAIDGIFGSGENDLLARKMIAQTIMNYGACVELMHIRNASERTKLYSNLVNNESEYATQMGIDFSSLPDWLEGNPHGYMYFGSPMLAYAIIEAAAGDKLGGIGYLEKLQRYYELVPILHVFLDGVADDKPDFASGNFAPNLSRLIASGEVAGFRQAEIEGETQQKSKAFVRYLLEGIKEMKGTVHLQIIKDILKFYQLELARNPAKDDNVLANELLDYMDAQLASI